MMLLLIVAGVISALIALIFYYKHSNAVLKNKAEASEFEKKAVTYEKDAYKERARIEQANSNLPDDNIRDRMRNKNYTRPSD